MVFLALFHFLEGPRIFEQPLVPTVDAPGKYFDIIEQK